MIVKLTAQDKKQIERLHSEYAKKITEIEALIEKLAPTKDFDEEKEREIQSRRPKMPEPIDFTEEGTPIYSQESLKPYNAEQKKINDELNQLFETWLDSGAPGFREARKERLRLISEQGDAINALFKQIERREFSKLGGDRDKIIQSAEEQINLMIDNRFNAYQEKIRTHKDEDGDTISGFSARDLRVDGEKIYLDSKEIIEDCKRSLLTLHYEALSHDQEAIRQIDDLILSIVDRSPKTSSDKGVLGAMIEFDLGEEVVEDVQIRTTRPDTMLVPTSKLVNEAFLGDLYPGTGKKVNVQKKSLAKKSPVYTLISIDIEEMKNQGVTIQGRRELRPYDQEVHDAITSQYVEGGNEYITDSMIFDTISGKEGATLNPKQREAISNAITKLMFSHVKIDASEEAKKFGVEKFAYDGYLLPAERVTVSLNGTITECIHLFRTPPLYDYAEKRKQIGRMSVKLLNSPVNKNEETIALQGYLYRRILSMKGSSKLSPTIKYETVYKQLDVTAGSESSLRNKKMKIRTTVKKILDYWKKEKFILGYVENAHKSEKGKIDSITIRF